jgi:hypothetical protein
MEFAEMPWGILLILPPRSVTLPAKTTLVALSNFRHEPIVRLVRIKTTREIRLVDLFAPESTEKRPCSYTVLEVDIIQLTAKVLPPACRQNPSSVRGSDWNGAAGLFPGLS